MDVSRATNVSSRSRLGLVSRFERLGLVSAGDASVSVSGGEPLGLVLVSSFEVSCASVDDDGGGNK